MDEFFVQLKICPEPSTVPFRSKSASSRKTTWNRMLNKQGSKLEWYIVGIAHGMPLLLNPF